MRVFAFTEPQIESLASLAAGVWCALFHLVNGRVGSYRGISLDDYFAGPPLFPKEEGRIPRTVYSDAINHVGMIGHLQCTKRKIDPAGFPWERFENMVTSKYYEFRSNVR
jgi:N-acetyl-anhydromuramyl-L-alanine amidase AmpD